jgi:imidazolonepropionase-like amidohydrolase
LILAVALLAAAGRGESPSADEPPAQVPNGEILAVVGGLLIDGTGAEPVPDSAVIIEAGRVMAAGPRRQVRIPPGSVPVDATGLTVLPGLVDMHTHLVDGVDLGEFLRFGVTSVRHMGDTTLEWIRDLKKSVDEGRRPGPRIFHCGRFVVSQPPLDPARFPDGGLDRYAIMREAGDAERVIEELVDAGADLVKIKAHMNRQFLSALCAAAGEAGLTVSVDNSGGRDAYSVMDALEAGARGMEHLSGVPFDDEETAQEIQDKMLDVRAFAVPTFALLARTVGEGRLAKRREFVRQFASRGGMVVTGTDTPAGGTPVGRSIHEELMYLTEAGLTPLQALVAATGAAGRALGYQGLVGTIETGSYADLVIVRGTPHQLILDSRRIDRVFKNGVQVYPLEDPAAH